VWQCGLHSSGVKHGPMVGCCVHVTGPTSHVKAGDCELAERLIQWSHLSEELAYFVLNAGRHYHFCLLQKLWKRTKHDSFFFLRLCCVSAYLWVTRLTITQSRTLTMLMRRTLPSRTQHCSTLARLSLPLKTGIVLYQSSRTHYTFSVYHPCLQSTHRVHQQTQYWRLLRIPK
jgi:hypothetical protein